MFKETIPPNWSSGRDAALLLAKHGHAAPATATTSAPVPVVAMPVGLGLVTAEAASALVSPGHVATAHVHPKPAAFCNGVSGAR